MMKQSFWKTFFWAFTPLKSRPLTPRMSKMFAMFEPMTLPTAMDGLFWREATTEVASSGNEVPMATMVNPITRGGMRRNRAKREADSTNKSEPFNRTAKPKANEARSSGFMNLVELKQIKCHWPSLPGGGLGRRSPFFQQQYFGERLNGPVCLQADLFLLGEGDSHAHRAE